MFHLVSKIIDMYDSTFSVALKFWNWMALMLMWRHTEIFFIRFWSTIYSTKRGWSAGHYAEAIWRLQSVVKTSVKDKRAAEKKTDEASVQRKIMENLASTKSTSESSWFLYFKHWFLYKMHFFETFFKGFEVLWINF